MRILVVGGGIVGACCAVALAERGAGVTVIDAGPPRFGTSLGNAGHIVTSHSSPFASPGMVSQGIRSLLSRDGAFALAPQPGRGIGAWLIEFARHCTQANVDTLHPGLRALLQLSAEQMRSLSTIPVNKAGLWQVFTEAGATERAEREAHHHEQLGVTCRLLNATELLSEPALRETVVAGVELKDDLGIDPAQLWRYMRNRSEAAGAAWSEGVVTDLRHTPIVRTADATRDHPCDVVVVATGAWTPALTRGLAYDLPIRAAKGYSVTVQGIAELPTRPMLLMDQRTAINPLGDRLRLSTRFELTSPDDRKVIAHRVAGILDRAREALHIPAQVAVTDPWTGVRPASADGAPFIGPLPNRAGRPTVLVAAGHGMIGTSLAVGTADLISRYVFEEEISQAELALSPRRISR